MIRAAVAAGTVLLVTACGRPAGDSNAAAPNPAPAASPSAIARPIAGAGSPLSGQVSGLSGDTSGLNVRITDVATIVDLPADALFEFDHADLTPAATEQLGKAADLIRRSAAGDIAVTGYTDAQGEDAYNQNLSERRAQAVANWFRDQVGVRQRSFAVVGKGEADPVAPNTRPDGSDDAAGRAKNRRVEVSIPR